MINTCEKQFREENIYFVSQFQSFQSIASKPGASKNHHGGRAWERKRLSSWKLGNRGVRKMMETIYIFLGHVSTNAHSPIKPNFLIRSHVRNPKRD